MPDAADSISGCDGRDSQQIRDCCAVWPLKRLTNARQLTNASKAIRGRARIMQTPIPRAGRHGQTSREVLPAGYARRPERQLPAEPGRPLPRRSVLPRLFACPSAALPLRFLA